MPGYAIGADGVRIAFEEIGSGAPLVLVSGQGGDRHLWDEIRSDFADRHRVITFDHRGTGDSDKPERPEYSTRGFAQDVITILDALSIPRAHVYGASMGGRVAQMLAIDHPRRIGALVLGCTTSGNAHGIPRSAEVNAVLSDPPLDRDDHFRVLLDFLVTPQWAAANAALVEGWRRQFHEVSLPAYASRLHFLASEGHEAWELLPTISAATLVIHGGDDQMNPTANAQLLADRIPDAELRIIPGARHRYFFEAREDARNIVRDFIGRHPL